MYKSTIKRILEYFETIAFLEFVVTIKNQNDNL